MMTERHARRSRPFVGVVAALAAMAWAGAAWACVPQPLVSVTPNASGPGGGEVTVDAVAVPGAAEVRWNTFDGPVLARANGPTFSVAVTIPQVPDGLYGLIVIGRGPDAGVTATGRAAFHVTSGSGAQPQSAAPGQAGRPTGEADGSSAGPSFPFVFAGGAGLVLVGWVAGSLLRGRRRPSAAGELRTAGG